jgi:serine phosphatase RsbU (regulator of sigma subunit)
MNLSKIYARLGDYKKAFEYHEFFSLTKDSLLNEENQRSINEMQAKYETGQKEKEIQIKNLQINERDAQIRGQRITIFASAGGLILLFLLAIVVFRAYKLKQKANLLLKKQKLEIEIQKGIIEEKNRDITDSITYAKHIQDAILPEKEKILQVLPESFILFMPKDIVSGDFYWYMQAGNGDILVASADCTGHGVPGAFMSMICSNTLTKIVSEYQLTQPGEVLTRLNKEIKSALKQKGENSSSRDGMDIALLKFSFGNDTCRVDFAGANRPLIYFENGNMREIVPNKSAIGGFTHDDYQFINHSASLKKDSMLYIFSDGYADQFGGANGKKFMLKNLKELFKTIRNLSIKEQEKILREVFLSWKGGLEQVDDVLVIWIRV